MGDEGGCGATSLDFVAISLDLDGAFSFFFGLRDITKSNDTHTLLSVSEVRVYTKCALYIAQYRIRKSQI